MSWKLTGDDVLNAVYNHGARWQAIADELNAKLGGGECELICYKPKLPDSLKDADVEIAIYKCSVCDEQMFSDYNFCPNCGRKVKKVVEK